MIHRMFKNWLVAISAAALFATFALSVLPAEQAVEHGKKNTATFDNVIGEANAANADDKPGACESQSVDAPGQGCAKALVGLFEQGKDIFRFDTFGDQDYWGGMLQLHKAIEGAALGGVGPGVSPRTALTVAGLKVDVDALPGNVQASSTG